MLYNLRKFKDNPKTKMNKLINNYTNPVNIVGNDTVEYEIYG